MKNNFKFFSKNVNVLERVDFLREYLRRLDYCYVSNYQIFTSLHPLYVQAVQLHNNAVELIERKRLITYQQVRSYVYLGYRDITNDTFRVNHSTDRMLIMDSYNFINRRTNEL